MLRKKLSALLAAVVISTAAFFMPINAQAATYKGVDVYEYDDIENYQTLKNDGVSVVIQKATQGLYHNDNLLSYRYNQLMAYGFKVGFYHFADNSGDPVGEAKHFLAQIKGLHSDTVLWLDIENEPNWTQQQAIDYVNSFVSYVRSQGYSIGIYTGLSFYYEYLSGNVPSDIPLWLASYGKQPQQYPNLVSWQYAEDGSLNGAIGSIDLDYFNDSIFLSNVYVSNDIRSVQHDLQRVSCLESGESNATGMLDDKTKDAIRKFRSVAGLPDGTGIDSNLVNALNAVVKKPTLGIEWTNVPAATRFIQWWLGLPKTGTWDSNMVIKVRDWQVKAGIWSASGADGVIRTVDWNKILK